MTNVSTRASCQYSMKVGGINAMGASGAWHGRILTDFFDRDVIAAPDAPAVVAVSSETGQVARYTYAELAALADRIALGLYVLGVRKGDIVSFQPHDCSEFLAPVLACIRIGAVTHPIMPILRHRELTFSPPD